MKASEMLAARKAAKKEQAVKKYARDNIGNQRLGTSGNYLGVSNGYSRNHRMV